VLCVSSADSGVISSSASGSPPQPPHTSKKAKSRPPTAVGRKHAARLGKNPNLHRCGPSRCLTPSLRLGRLLACKPAMVAPLQRGGQQNCGSRQKPAAASGLLRGRWTVSRWRKTVAHFLPLRGEISLIELVDRWEDRHLIHHFEVKASIDEGIGLLGVIG
jgi:hypothetical protein